MYFEFTYRAVIDALLFMKSPVLGGFLAYMNYAPFIFPTTQFLRVWYDI